MSPTHYETLELTESATQVEIKHAYRRLAKKYHPDRNKKKGAEEKFKEINRAYQVLGDPDRRRIYDYDLQQARKAGASSASGSATGGTPPPPSGSSGAGAQAGQAPPPPPGSTGRSRPSAAPSPPAQGAYRLLFFVRGAVVGGITVAAIFVFVLISYLGCHVSSTPTVQSAATRSVSAEPKDELTSVPVMPEPTPAVPEATPTAPEAIPVTPEPTPAIAEPTPVTAEPTSPESEPTPVPPQFHLCGKWRGSFEWRGTMVPFAMWLDQHGSEISGVWTEGHDGVIWRATIHGWIDGSTVTLVKRYVSVILVKRYGRIDSTATFVSTEPASDLLRGTWESSQEGGFWQAVWESRVVADGSNDQPRRESWRVRPRSREVRPSWRTSPPSP